MSYQAPPPNYGQPAYGGAPIPQQHPRAVTSLVLGLVSLFCCGLVGIPAFIIGRKTEAEINASGGQLSGAGMAKAGWILGIIALAWMVIGTILYITVFASMMATDATTY